MYTSPHCTLPPRPCPPVDLIRLDLPGVTGPIGQLGCYLINLSELEGEACRVEEWAQVEPWKTWSSMFTSGKRKKTRTIVIGTVRFLRHGLNYKGIEIVRTYCMIRGRDGRHLVSVPRVLEEELLDLFCHLERRQERAPFVYKFGEHAVRPAFIDLAKSSEDGEFVVCHTHVGLQNVSL